MFGRRKRERDLDRELQAHLELEAEECGDLYAARRSLGNRARIMEAVREAWGWTSAADAARTVRHASRSLRKRPVFTAVGILSLALAIGANTAVFSLARGIVLKTLPVAGADRLVLLSQYNSVFHIVNNCCFQYAFFKQIKQSDPDFEDVLATDNFDTTIAVGDEREKITAENVSPNYFRMLGTRAVLGRLLDESDETSTSVCVISFDLWQRLFGGREDVIGRTVHVNNDALEIVGVTMPGFHGASVHRPSDLQTPAAMGDKRMGAPGNSWAFVLAKLKPGVTRAAAEARANSIGRQIEKSLGLTVASKDNIYFRDGSQGLSSRKEQYATPVLVLFLLVGVVLLVACCNLTAALLARGVERSREAGMRLAIGASRGALVRQFLTESLLLALAGGAGGWFVALAANRVLLHILDSTASGLTASSSPDAPVFLFCLAITLLTGLLFGILPAWRAAQADPLIAIHGGSGAPGPVRSYASRALIAAQIALSLALLFGAGLFTQTLRNLHSINVGFSKQNLALIEIDHSSAPRSAPAFFDELLRRARELPEVQAASLSSISALSGSMMAFSLRVPGAAATPLQSAFASIVSPGYLQTLGIPLLAGRDFDPSDRGAAETRVIVNQQFAAQHFAGDALGKAFFFGGRNPARIIGVAGTARYRSLREDPQAMIYLPLDPPRYPPSLFLQLRTSTPDATIARVRSLVKTIDSSASIDTVSTMAEQIDQGLARERMLALLSTVLGGVSVFLAAMGLYGVLAFSVARRTREIGIRMAIGADRGGILAMVLKDGAWIVLAGLAAGVPLALGCGRLVSSLLYGLKAQDAATAIAAIVLLTVMALAASLLPAWRAARVDPMAALRNE